MKIFWQNHVRLNYQPRMYASRNVMDYLKYLMVDEEIKVKDEYKKIDFEKYDFSESGESASKKFSMFLIMK